VKLSHFTALLVPLVLATPGWGANLYVSTSGSDSNDCLSNATACLTLAHVEAVSAAGDTINLAAGTYRISTPIFPKSNQVFLGPVCDPITTPGSCRAIINGSTNIGPLAVLDPITGYYKVTGQTQNGFIPADINAAKQCDPNWQGCLHPEDLWFDSVPLQHMECTTTACNSGTPPTLSTGQWWFDYTNHIIYFFDNPSGHLVETGVSPAIAVGRVNITGANNVTFQYLTIQKSAAPIGN
jgi:hypothetical protein